MWRKGNPCYLVGLKSAVPPTENCMEIPQKTKNRPYDPEIPLLGIYQKNENTDSKNMSTSMLISGLFTVVNMWKQP